MKNTQKISQSQADSKVKISLNKLETGETILQSFAATYILQKALYGEESIQKDINEVVTQIYDKTKTERGVLLIFLYALLVIPKELIKNNKYKEKYKDVNLWIKQNNMSENEKSDYEEDKEGIDYVRHMRNSVSHGKVKYDESNKFILFFDEDDHGHSCHFSVSMGKNISMVISKLREIITSYINEKYNSNFSNNNSNAKEETI